MDNLISYIIICLVLVLSPGPNTFLVFSTASSIGKYDSLLKIAGLVTATYIHGMLSLFGISLILLKSETLFLGVKIIGALYLFYLGAKFIYQAWGMKSDNAIHVIKVKEQSNAKSYRDGFFTQLLNPKVSMFYIAAFPQFINFSSGHYHLQGVLLTTVHALIIGSWFTFMTLFIDKFSRFTKNKRTSQAIMYVSGGFLVYFSALLVLQPLPNL